MTIVRGKLEKGDKEYFEKMNPGYTATGETLEIGGTDYVVFRGRRTRYGMVRDCGDHYIKACYSEYISIDKETLEVTRDVDDR